MTYSNEDLDFVKLINIILKGKYILIFTIISFLIFGVIYLNLQEKVYSSKVNIIINNRPPDQSDQSHLKNHRKIIYDFKTLLYDQKTFYSWKEMSNSDIQYEDFTIFEEFENLDFEKKNDKLKFNLIYSNNLLVGDPYIDINTNQKRVVLEYFDYFNFINNILLKNYLSEVSEIKIIKGSEINTFQSFIYNFLNNSKNNNQIIIFEKPSLPVKVYPSTSKILIIFLFFGSLVGFISLSLIELFKNQTKN